MSRIASDLSVIAATRSFAEQTRAVNTTIERLSTGHRINRAKDDPSGLIAAESLGARASAINGEINRLERQSLLFSTEEGARTVVSDLLIELNATIIEAANTGANDLPEREALQFQADAIIDAIDYIYQTTSFNDQHVFKVEPTTPNTFSKIEATQTEADLSKRALSELRAGAQFNLIDGNLEIAQQITTGAIETNATRIGALGSAQKHVIGAQIRSLHTELENVLGAKSIIKDTDYAQETATLSRHQILQQAAMQSLKIANALPAAALQLLG